MAKYRLVLIALINIYFCKSFSQEKIDSIISQIRIDFQKTENVLKSCRIMTYKYVDLDSDPQEINFTGYFLPYGRLIKLVASFNYSDGDRKVEYYLNNTYLYFIFAQGTKKDGTKIEERIYFENNSIINALFKKLEPGNRNSFFDIPNINHPLISKTSSIANSYYDETNINKFLTFPVFPKSDSLELKIKYIRQEYNKIKTMYISGSLKHMIAHFKDDHAYWNNTSYSVYYNDKNEMVLLTYAFNDEGYSTCDSVYFKNQKPFFILSTHSDPGDDDYINEKYKNSQFRIYIFNDNIIRMLKKMKSGESNDFSELPNMDITDDIKDISEESLKILGSINVELWRLFYVKDKEYFGE